MKKVLVFAVVLIVAAVLIFWIGGSIVQSQSMSDPWPRKLGTLRDVESRYPPTAQSPAATELVRLATAADVNLTPGSREQKPAEKIRGALADYIRIVIEEPADPIAPPPPLVTRYLDEHKAQFDAIRDHVLSGEPIVWQSNLGADLQKEPIPNLLGHLQLARVFVARALIDREWNELHAAWELVRPLWNRPELISDLIALSTARMVNAAARKMPEPKEPAWFAKELRPFDAVGAMMAAQQAEVWRVRQIRAKVPFYARPFAMYYGPRVEREMHRWIDAVDRSGACDVKSVPAPKNRDTRSIVSAFGRVLRYRAEVEATERVLQLRRGETPSPKSQCSDGNWIVNPNSVRFSRDIPVEPPGHRVPLLYSIDRDVLLLGVKRTSS